MYPDVTGRTLLAWYRIGREPVFHARCPMRLVLPARLLIQGRRTGYHFCN
nr:MAG TPA: BAF1 / ABF1 chromatin reorganizing factor [Caudoviricetes sp.]